MKRHEWITAALVAMLAVGAADVCAQATYKCKNAAGVIQYSDKPCLPTQDSVPWQPKYSPNNVERLTKKPDQTAGSVAKKPPEQRKSAYTRWLDSKEEGEAKNRSAKKPGEEGSKAPEASK